MQRSFLLFSNAIHTKATQRTYIFGLNSFMKSYQLKDYDSVAKMDSKMLQTMIEDFVMKKKSDGLSRAGITNYLAPIEVFCDVNEININFKKIHRLLPPNGKKSGGKPYTTDQIRLMLSLEPKLRNKAIVHFIAASGIRLGGFEGLKVKHAVDFKEGCKIVTVYPDTKDEYLTFLTPEASKILDHYIEKRRKDGEYLSLESPLFRIDYKLGIAKPRPVSQGAIAELMNRIVRRAGIRSGYTKKRRETQLDHGFRKRWNTTVKNTDGMKIILAEKMTGHTVQSLPLDTVYNVPEEDRLFAEYRKAIPELTIDDSARKEADLQKERQENSKLQKIIQEKNDALLRIEKIEAYLERQKKTIIVKDQET